MKNIQDLIRKIQQIGDISPWRSIDKDLMLEQIRHLYDAVLALDVQNSAAALHNDDEINALIDTYESQLSENEALKAEVQATLKEEDWDNKPAVNANFANELAEDEPYENIEIPKAPMDWGEPIIFTDEIADIALSKDENTTPISIKEIEEAFNNVALGNVEESIINIELPRSEAVTDQNAPEETIENDDSDDAFYEKLKHLAKPKPAIGQNFVPPVHVKQKDIRNAIGLNDKYLFLNELFNNDKDAYDFAISKINNLDDYAAAKQWVDDNLKSEFKWDKDDSTVATFYGLLEKHFTLI